MSNAFIYLSIDLLTYYMQ